MVASNIRGPAQSFNACPYCLTVIPSDQEPVFLDNDAEVAADQTSLLSSGAEIKPDDCRNHLGYLSERPGKDIPDDCLMCKAIVQCMLRTKESVGN